MALTPANLSTMVTIGTAVEVETPASQPSRTYAVNWQTGRVSGFVDTTDALKQAIHKILQTERFAYLIYSWNYGFEANRLIGQSAAFLRSEIQRLVTEALLADDPDHGGGKLQNQHHRKAAGGGGVHRRLCVWRDRN